MVRSSAADDLQTELAQRVTELLSEAPPGLTDDRAFWAAQFDRGLARVDAPVGLGGMGLERGLQRVVDTLLADAGAPRNEPNNLIGVQMVIPVLLEFGTSEQQHRHIRRAFTCEEIWCQLFSEPDAGSDLASLSTRATRDGVGWRVSGQKVWTTCAHLADKALLLARTDLDGPRHQGLTFLLLDMRQSGVEIRPLRQITGEAEYNEVFLSDAFVPDDSVVGEPGQGWAIAMHTLASERESSADLNTATQRMVRSAVGMWHELEPWRQTGVLRDQLAHLCADARVFELLATSDQVNLSAHGPMVKLQYASLWQRVSALCMNMRGAAALMVDDYSMTQPDRFTSTFEVDMRGDQLAKVLLASQALSIAGGTTNINKNVIAERTLGLPR